MTGPVERGFPGEPEEALAAVARVAEEWGAEWSREGAGGRLALPVVAGLQRGVVGGRLSVAADGADSRLRLDVETAELHTHRQGVAFLALAGSGALVVVLWPFVPSLLPVAPLGAVLAIAGWFLVVSRLRTAGPAEFLAAVAAAGTTGAAEEV